ncbi:MAG: SH3 domain-containing protein [Bacilli bacterium]|jgi:hypothetical protein|nr:SH3 domain-containing protein [Bacilli bacterium]MDY0063803.1 SH3 domain-containing protein [Bacilli bacterium]
MKKILLFSLIFLNLVLNTGCDTNQDIELIDVHFVVDGAEIELKELPIESTLNLESFPAVEIREEMIFDGWYRDEEYSVLYEEDILLKSIILYGRYLPKQTEEEAALNKITLPTTINRSIDLPQTIDEYSISWVSSHPHILDSSGNYSFCEEDQTIILIGKIVAEKTYEKEFEILITSFPYREIFASIEEQFHFDNPVTNNLSLLVALPEDVGIQWKSSNQEILSDTGIIYKSKVQQEVSLTLKLNAYGIEESFVYSLVIAPRELTVNDSEYFIERLNEAQNDVDNPILTAQQILLYNDSVTNTPAAKTYNMELLPATITRDELLEKIQYYNFFTKYNIYDYQTNQLLTSLEKDNILLNRNVEAIPYESNVKYAVSVAHVSLRSYPTSHYSNNESVDRFQETGFSIGIPMVVYHQSLDQNWYFVQMFHYFGWVQSKDIGICSRDIFLNYVNPNQFIIVKQPTFLIKNEIVRMGYRIPYQSKTDSTFTLAYPKRLSSGYLSIESVQIDKSEDIHDGYLLFNYINLLNQAFAFIGTKYSWGDKIIDGFDCSSTQAAIYACFGFVLGRNTSNQWATVGYGKTINSISNSTIINYPVGTLFYTSGHVLMYIGTDLGGNAWMLHNTSSGNICKIQTLNSYGTNNIKYVLEFQ